MDRYDDLALQSTRTQNLTWNVFVDRRGQSCVVAAYTQNKDKALYMNSRFLGAPRNTHLLHHVPPRCEEIVTYTVYAADNVCIQTYDYESMRAAMADVRSELLRRVMNPLRALLLSELGLV